MPRLIKVDPPELKVKHKKCGAQIAYYPKEVKDAVYHDYGGGSEVWYYIVCPNCGEKIEVTRPKDY